ncbi:MAG: RnfABCDGE type electron transport complex subunit G [Clostridia bacterium]|nr:RnfABCDGE type electron transport complex subunit G [Clostridia bacterium]
MKKSILKDTLSLVLITLVAALCLAGVFQLTKNSIAEAEDAERMDSFKVVFPDAMDFRDIPAETIAAWNAEHPGAELILGYEALDKSGGDATGLVLSAVSHKGYGGDVTLSVGIRNDGTLSGVKVTSMSETSGLGANCTKEEWVAQFKGIKAESVGYVRDGDPGEGEINAITSATVTTKAVLEAVNQALAFALLYMNG